MSKPKHFSPEFFAGNRQRLRAAFGGQAPIVVAAHASMQETADQAYPFRQNSNFWYLTGLDDPDMLLVMDKTKDYLIAPERSDYQKVFEGEIDTNRLVQTSGVEAVMDAKLGWKRLNKRLKLAKHVAMPQPPPVFLQPYGFYTNPAPRRLLKQVREANPDIELIDIRLHLARLRMIKSEPELVAIKSAIDHTVKTFKIVHKNLANYSNESDIQLEFDQYFLNHGLTHAYSPVVAHGQNATTLHYEANNCSINKNNVTMIDAGARYGKYCADITRTYALNPTKRQQAVHAAVLAVQEYAIDRIKPGVLLKEYEEDVRLYLGEKLRELGLIKSINKEVMRLWYPQLTSHFLGLDAHDAMDYDMPLAPNMVLTVEPGIYIKKEGIGVRIEDNLLVTETGSQNLSTRLPKTLR